MTTSNSNSNKKKWIKPEITGVSLIGKAEAIVSKPFDISEGVFDGGACIGPNP